MITEQRRSEKLKTALDKIENETDVIDFIKQWIDLTDMSEYEEKIPVKFSEQTGKPVEFEWRNCNRKFTDCIYTRSGFYKTINYKATTIHDWIDDIIEHDKVIIFAYRGHDYVIHPFSSSYDGGSVTAGIQIKRAERVVY